jgi:hypothetical protein
MADPFRDSIALDLSHLKREVPAIIERFSAEALQEVEDARDNGNAGGTNGNAGGTNGTTAFPGADSGADVASNEHGGEPELVA